MDRPDSLLMAARLLADAASLPWSEVQPYYRTLQEVRGRDHVAWLPKSAGRNIWAAHPHFIARLMFALAGGRMPEEAHDAVNWARAVTPNGREKYLSEKDAAGVLAPLESLFARLLTDPGEAMSVHAVEFKTAIREVVVRSKKGSEHDITFAMPPMSVPEREQSMRSAYRGIYRHGIIGGEVFVELAKHVSWRLRDQAPFETATTDDLGDDA